MSIPLFIVKNASKSDFLLIKKPFTIVNRKIERNHDKSSKSEIYAEPKGFLEKSPQFLVESKSAGYAHYEFPVTESASLPAEKTGADSLQIFFFPSISNLCCGTCADTTPIFVMTIFIFESIHSSGWKCDSWKR